MFDPDSPFQPVVGAWLAKIRLAVEFKGRRFDKDARDGMRFFAGPYDWLYGEERRKDRHLKQVGGDSDEDNEIPPPRFQMTVNRTAELVQIFGPVLYHRNPNRTVTPREYPLPDADLAAAFGGDPSAQLQLQQLHQQGTVARAIDAARAKLLSHYLNYTPNALDLKTEARKAIDEALIKGMGVLWQEVYTDPVGTKLVGSFYDSVDNLVIDPDATELGSAKWVARKRTQPVWEVERKFGLKPGSVRGNAESSDAVANAESDADAAYRRACGQTQDLLTYWEVYSKCGAGGRLTGIADWIRGPLEAFGDFCYVAVAAGHEHPLNVAPEVWAMEPQAGQQEVQKRLQWPTPFWADDSWPFVPISFHSIPNDPWPLSHLAPGMGELKFLNWAYSYLAGKIRISCRDFIAILEEASDSTRATVEHGADYEFIKLKGSLGKGINDLVSFLQHPQFNADIWRVVEAVNEQFDRRVGLTELMYGQSSRQLRSAAEAEMKASQTSVRPDEMANKVEDAMSAAARQEAIAVRWHLGDPQLVASVMGPVGASLWATFITPSNPADLLHSLEYRIEEGSVRKPNHDRDAQNATQAMNTVGPFFQSLVSAGLVGPFNTLLEMWCKANDVKPDGMLIPAPQPAPPAGGPPGQQPSPAGAGGVA